MVPDRGLTWEGPYATHAVWKDGLIEAAALVALANDAWANRVSPAGELCGVARGGAWV